MPVPTAHPTRRGTAPGAVQAALLHDLNVVPALARALPMGGLPRAGLLAQHCYVLCEVLAHELEYQSRLEGISGMPGTGTSAASDETAVRRAEVTAALDQVLRRLERLYSADRPGGLDHIDDHLSRLDHAAKAYFRSNRRDGPEPLDQDGSWWQGMPTRQRARIVAWASTAVDDSGSPLLRTQPLPVRVIVRLRYRPQALRRLRGLGLERPRDQS